MIETQVQTIEQMIQGLLASDPDYFLVDIRIKPTNNVKVFLDGDHGISIEKCTYYNRGLYKQIETAQLFPDNDFSLEVSSPGLDEPLKLYRQYLKNRGRNVEVLLSDGGKKEGKLVDVMEEGIIIEEPLPKKASKKPVEPMRHSISFDQIKSTKIQISFK